MQYSSVLPFTRGDWWGYPDGWVDEDLPQTNPTNPILLRFRAINNHHSMHVRASNWLAWVNSPFGVEEFATKAERDHARRVLTRLAALSG